MGLGLAFEGGVDSPEVDGHEENVTTARKVRGREKVIYFVHGGAYYVGNAATHRLVTIGVSKACNARVFGESYYMSWQGTACLRRGLMVYCQPSRIAWRQNTSFPCPCTMS